MELYKELYQKYKFLLMPVISGLSSIIIIALVVFPEITAYFQTSQEIKDLKEKTEKMEVRAQELSSIDKEANSDDLRVIMTVLPTEPDIPQAFSVVQQTVVKSGLILENVSFSNSRTGGEKNSFSLNITVAGQLNSIKTFLNEVDKMPQVSSIGSLSVAFHQGEVGAEIPLAIYYDPQKSAASAGENLPKLTEKEEELLAQLKAAVEEMSSYQSGEVDTSGVTLGKPDPFQ